MQIKLDQKPLKIFGFLLWLFLLSGTLFFVLGVFPDYQTDILNCNGGVPVKILDVRLWYSVADVQKMLSDLKPCGVLVYKEIAGKADMVFPLFYGGFLSFSGWGLMRFHSISTSKQKRFVLVVCLGVVLDFIENRNTLELLTSTPPLGFTFVSYAAVVSMLKNTILYSAFFYVLYLVFRFLKQALLR